MELFDEVFSYTNAKDLVNLACVDRGFHNFATKKIWDPTHNDWDKQCQIFMWACASGSTRALTRLLDEGLLTANFTYQAGYRKTLLDLTPSFYLHIPGWDFGRYQAFIPYTGDFHFSSTPQTDQKSSFWTPLHVAVSYGQGHAVDLLLKRGACVDAASRNYCKNEFWNLSPPGKYTPLHAAIHHGEDDIAKALISKGASIYVDCEVQRPERAWGPDRGRLTALHCCAIYGRLSTAQYLIIQAHDAAIDEIDEYGISPSCANPRITTTTPRLTTSISTTTTPRPEVITDVFKPEFVSLLHQACHDLKWDVIVQLISHGSDAFDADKQGTQPMLLCVRSFVRKIHCATKSPRGDPSKDVEEQLADLPRMIGIFGSCKMHSQAQRDTLTEAMSYALGYALVPLVAFLMDAGLDKSVLLDNQASVVTIGGWSAELQRQLVALGSSSRARDHKACYSDTGTHLGLGSEHHKLIGGQKVLLGELTKTFNLTNASYSKIELHSLFLALTQKNDDSITRHGCLEYLYQADGDGYILQHNDTFEALCEANLPSRYHGGGAEIILDYLNRGGKPGFMFSNGLSALFVACKSRNHRLVERLLDLGADPNQYTTTRENYEKHMAPNMWDGRDSEQVTLMRLLLRRGANPFRRDGEDPGLGFPFEICLDKAGPRKPFCPELFRELCKSSINDKTDDSDLFDVVDLACARGRYEYIQEIRAHAKTRVDAVIRENAALFLQKLLLNLSPLSELKGASADFRTILRMDEAIDTIQLLLQLGPSDILTSMNPHLAANARCHAADIRRYRFHWCLSERIVHVSDPDEEPSITILNERITWPSQWNINTKEMYWDREDAWTLAYIPSPWGCLCEPPYEPGW
ncbi:hypothetical protein PG991_007566 [Apiospora marii]|uniref:Peptidase A2 domain-containing protein n=1 Tax=Apiospora marii TaxID=335849 RepID=A0ABR1RTU0_9PEZI